jgi:hypothetical protein
MDNQTVLFTLKSSHRCPRCKTVKPLSEYNIRNNTTNRPFSYCRECQREYSRAHYGRNKEAHNRRRYANSIRYRKRNKFALAEFLSKRACVDCGLRDPVVFEFDHVRGAKSFTIGSMLHKAVSWKKILDEIEKCDIRCANCHRRKTAAQFGWEDWKSSAKEHSGDGR